MTWLRSRQRKKWLAVAFLLAMACCNLALAVRLLPALRNGYQDFTIYYTGAKLLLEGKSTELYNLNAQYQVQLQFTHVPIRHGALPFNHPPFEALPFVPLAYLSYWKAYLVWIMLSLIILAASLALLRRSSLIGKQPWPLLGLASLAFFPVAIGLIQGQDSIVLLLLLVLALISLERGAEVAAGGWLAAGLFRPHLVLPVALLLASRRPRVLFGFLPVSISLMAVWVAITGWGGPTAYVRFVLWTEHSDAGGFSPHAVPNLRGIVYSLIGSHAAGPLSGVLTLLLSVIVFGLAWYRIRHGSGAPSHSFCLATVVAMLISFHALAHDATILLPLALCLLGEEIVTEPGNDDRERLLLVTLLFLSPLYIGLLFRADSYFCVAFLILWLFIRLLRIKKLAESIPSPDY